MQNPSPIPDAEALHALRVLDRHKILVSWVDGKVEFRSAIAPPNETLALIDRHESAIVKLIRPNGDGPSLLDLARERHGPFLDDARPRRPPDVSDDHWQAAIDGLWVFLAAGNGAEAERLGWPKDELYAVPPLWSRVDLCGAALLIGDREIVNITSAEIRIKAASGSTLAFYRKPKTDYGVAYRARIKELGDDGLKEEPRLRAFESVVGLYLTNHPGIGVDEAKAAVQIAIAQETTKETTTP